jgi:DNA polymerase-3 subunit alpha
MTMEKETTGLYLSGHPMDAYRTRLREIGAVPIGAILADFAREDGPVQFADGQRITIAGVVSSSKTKTTKNNSLMAYVVVEDDTASMELLCFSRVLERCGSYLKENQPVIIQGKLSVRDEKAPQIMCDSAAPLDAEMLPPAPEKRRADGAGKYLQGQVLYLKVPTVDSPQMRHVNRVVKLFPGKVPVKIVAADTRKVYGGACVLHQALLDELREVLGADHVVLK